MLNKFLLKHMKENNLYFRGGEFKYKYKISSYRIINIITKFNYKL